MPGCYYIEDEHEDEGYWMSGESKPSSFFSSIMPNSAKALEVESRDMARRVLGRVTDVSDSLAKSSEKSKSTSLPESRSMSSSDEDFCIEYDEYEYEHEELYNSCDKCEYDSGESHVNSLSRAYGDISVRSLTEGPSIVRSSEGALVYADINEIEPEMTKAIAARGRYEARLNFGAKRLPYVYMVAALVCMATVNLSSSVQAVVLGFSYLSMASAVLGLLLGKFGRKSIDEPRRQLDERVSSSIQDNGCILTADQFVDYIDKMGSPRERCDYGRFHLPSHKSLEYVRLSDRFVDATNESLSDVVYSPLMKELLLRLRDMTRNPGSSERMKLGRNLIMKEVYQVNDTVAAKKAAAESARISAIDDAHEMLNNSVIGRSELD